MRRTVHLKIIKRKFLCYVYFSIILKEKQRQKGPFEEPLVPPELLVSLFLLAT